MEKIRKTVIGKGKNKKLTYVFSTPEDLAANLAEKILEMIKKAKINNKQFFLGCPTGRSPFDTYREIGKLAGERKQDLSHLILVMMDDYVLPDSNGGFKHCPSDAHYSCRRFVYEDMQAVFNEGLSEEKQLQRENIWFPDPSDPAAYDVRIKTAGGVDLFIVASGASDGHIAFNPAGTPSNAPSRIIRISESTRKDNLGTFPEFRNLSEVPEHGISIGLKSISELSKQIVLIIHGEHKQYSVQRLNKLDSFSKEWPVSIIYNALGEVSVWLDERAAQGLIKGGI